MKGAILALGLLSLSQVAQPPASVRLSGEVVDVDSGAPVPGARVLAIGQRSRQQEQVIADSAGRFVFATLPPDRYRVVAEAADYAIDPAAASIVEMTASRSLRLVLRRGVAISGQIFDANGDPVRGLAVTALRRMPGPRGISVTPVAQRPPLTSDLGVFRLSSLPPGDYFVVAFPRIPQLTATAMLTTYYPGTPDARSASVLTLHPGDSKFNVNFMVITAPGFEISGTVLDPQGRPRAGAIVTLMPQPLTAPIFVRPLMTGPDGTFRAPGVASGRYRLNAGIASAPVPEDQLGGFISNEFAASMAGERPFVNVEVIDADVHGVTIVVPDP